MREGLDKGIPRKLTAVATNDNNPQNNAAAFGSMASSETIQGHGTRMPRLTRSTLLGNQSIIFFFDRQVKRLGVGFTISGFAMGYINVMFYFYFCSILACCLVQAIRGTMVRSTNTM